MGVGDRAGHLDVTGADALGRDDLGRVASGAQADLVAFALDDFRDGVTGDPLRTLIMNGKARGARLGMVAGEVIMTDGRPTRIDVDEFDDRAQALFDRMRRGYSERSGSARRELFPPSFPVVG